MIMKIIKRLSSTIDIPKQKTIHLVGYGLLDNLARLDCFRAPDVKNFLLLTDINVYKIYGKRVISSLNKLGKEVIVARVAAGEQSKSFDTAISVCGTFLENRVSRKSVLITLGGGVITDLGGFIGSIILRGIPVIHLPSTLLAQIDAGLGGKNGIDLWVKDKMLKNMVGKIEQAHAVVSDVGLLSSLPKREITNGLCEMVKYWVGWGKPSIGQLLAMKTPKRWRNDSSQVEELAKTIICCQQIKIDIVKQDPFETKGLREKLNLGHTIGHAIEGETFGKLSHGECVALGLIGAVKISTRLKLMKQKTAIQIIETIKNLGLPTFIKGPNIEKVTKLLSYDKKRGTFVLIKEIGDLITGVKVEAKLVKIALLEVIL